ncbi:MAG: hypothetical protein QG599_2202 [Pseudomonadota bacterium]|nr:hypothetical protein [Pseudomonadota bacterium]
MKIRHILLALAALLAIAFMQPLMTFLGGLTLVLGAGAFIFRDLPSASQAAIERRVLSWLRRARVNAEPDLERPPIRRRRPPNLSSEAGLPVPSKPAPRQGREQY